MRLLILLGLLGGALCQYDNGVIGDPVVHCGDSHFEVSFSTFNPFRGVVFVRSHLEDPRCRTPPSDHPDSPRNATLRIGFGDCDVKRTISGSPKGVFVSTQLVLAFHPDFLTKVDRVFNVQCFYMEMERRLMKEIKVNMPPPQLHTKQVPMPVCKYEVLDGSPTGPPVLFATVGQMVYHKWTCDAEQEGLFCMTVHSCFVDDGNGDRVQLLDDKGCAHDKYLLTNLEYPGDLEAGREAHVYKYADRDNMYFDCQISITIKEPGAEYCEIPSCPDPPRRRRSHLALLDGGNATVADDISSPTEYIFPEDAVVSASWMEKNFDNRQGQVCMTATGVSSVFASHLLLIAVAFLFIYNTYQLSSTRKA